MMLSLDPVRIERLTVPVSTTWLLAECMESKGKQDLWVRQKPKILKALREQAVIQSAESSNRIEGVTVASDRLRPLVLGRARPRDRSEEEIQGYRKALDWIFKRKRPVPVIPDTILHLHGFAQGGTTNDAGKWKARDNEIQEVLPDGRRVVRFKTVPARQTVKTVKDLCSRFTRFEEEGALSTVLLDFIFVFDLSCIHPFRDGNGRVCRLMTLLFLLRHGFDVGRFISLERIIEGSREGYYGALKRSSKGWHAGRNDLVPWLNFSLSTLRAAYREFQSRVEGTSNGLGKADLVKLEIERQISSFTLAELKAQLPSVSPQMIKKILAELKDSGRVRLTGRGRGARWERISSR
ncbi:MAG: Fic family protein [Planctomycetota bacterium]|jgi:Fic family protein